MQSLALEMVANQQLICRIECEGRDRDVVVKKEVFWEDVEYFKRREMRSKVDETSRR